VNQSSADFFRPLDLWTWRGKVGRAKYAGVGFFLFAIKHTLDRIAALSYGYQFTFLTYWVETEVGIENITRARAEFLAVLVLIALPFIWVGVVLTLRRLRDVNLPLWLVVLFFVPFLNLFFFLLLSILPSGTVKTNPADLELSTSEGILSRILPKSEIGSAAFGILITTILAVLFTVLGVYVLDQYGWGLFIGIPFFLGLNSVLIYGYHARRTFGKSLLVSLSSVLLVAAALVMIAFEGFICLVMAAPLAIVLAFIGGSIGYLLQRECAVRAESFQLFGFLILALPLLMALERVGDAKSPIYAVRTSVVVDAPREKVWQNLVAFSELPDPKESLFQTGIAYPIRAEIKGSGVGAVRHCVFSTGAFVEPIKVWNEPELLRFDVASQPPVMTEWSLYQRIDPPHLEHYLVSRQGQFLLTPLPNGRTLLEGTTWYENRMWPGQYWRLWSDFIIHRIHHRVLAHIKGLSEKDHANRPKA